MSAQNLWSDYGVPARVPNNARMFNLTNEQIGIIASLVTTTNDVFSWQIPYPFYVDQENVAMIIWRMDFIYRTKITNPPAAAGVYDMIQVDIQYSDKEPATNWDGAGEDTEDENIQAMFDGPFIFGETGETGEADADGTITIMIDPLIVGNVHYYPPDGNGLDAFFPVTVVFTNMSYDRDIVDNVADPATMAGFEKIGVRVFFTTRNLTPQEKSMIRSELYGLVPLS